jgi:hypothetical protein
MVHLRRGWLAPPFVALAVVGGLAGAGAGRSGAADPAWDPPPCPLDLAAPPTAAASWFRLDDVIDAEGTLSGRRLAVGRVGSDTTRSIALAPESFAGGPFGGLVLVGTDDGARSSLRLVDPGGACAIGIGDSTAVIRSGLVSADGGAVLEHRVDRASRADLGVWRRPRDGSRPTRILGPLDADPTYGPTFMTELDLAADGRLAVASCGERRCRARVLEPATNTVVEVPDIGALVGLTGSALVSYAPCPGLPCGIEAVDLESGQRRVLAETAGLAVLAGAAGERVVYETAAGIDLALRAVDVATGLTWTLGIVPDGLRLQPSASRTGAAVDVPVDDVVLAPDGRVGEAGSATQVVDSVSGSTAALEEVFP